MSQAHILISGFVQGVGFRYFIRRNAVELGLKGWVRNTPDNRVEAVFQGSKEDIENMIQLCKNGPFLAEVKNVEVEWEEIDQRFESFEIVI